MGTVSLSCGPYPFSIDSWDLAADRFSGGVEGRQPAPKSSPSLVRAHMVPSAGTGDVHGSVCRNGFSGVPRMCESRGILGVSPHGCHGGPNEPPPPAGLGGEKKEPETQYASPRVSQFDLETCFGHFSRNPNPTPRPSSSDSFGWWRGKIAGDPRSFAMSSASPAASSSMADRSIPRRSPRGRGFRLLPRRWWPGESARRPWGLSGRRSQQCLAS